MAGAGYKLYSTGDVLSASDVNTYLQQQTVMVFASAAARTTALASVLAEGMVTYLKDTDVVEIYTGAAWVSLDDPNAIQNSIVTAKGDIIGASAASTPARLATGTTGQVLTVDTTTATGLKWATPATSSNMGLVCVKAKTSFSAVSSFTADSVFTSSYANYVIMASFTSSAGATMNINLRSGGTTASGANYSYQILSANGTSVTGSRVTNNTGCEVSSSNGSDSSTLITTLFQPQVAAGTNIQSSYNYSGGNFQTPVNGEIKGNHSVTTSYDGFVVAIGSGTMTGSYTVYGYGVTV
jgi:hypothetical protein